MESSPSQGERRTVTHAVRWLRGCGAHAPAVGWLTDITGVMQHAIRTCEVEPNHRWSPHATSALLWLGRLPPTGELRKATQDRGQLERQPCPLVEGAA